MKKYMFFMALLPLILSSCGNQDWEYADYDYTTVYFAYQTPVRTLVMGEDVFDTSLDNLHQSQIMVTMGGVYENKKVIKVGVSVDNTLCNNLTFSQNGEPVKAMPATYYSLASNQITIPKGNVMGGVVVQFKDAFFEDTLALKATYVIPMVITDVDQADSILSGKARELIANPWRLKSSDWDIKPKDYILYAVKFVNKWHGNYLRRGKDILTATGGNTSTKVRRKTYVENDEVCSISTKTLSKAIFPVSVVSGNSTYTCDLILTFNNDGTCTISGSKYNVSGTGRFQSKGEKKSWGNADRDALYLDYQIDFGNLTCQTKDTLVVRDRGTKMETFTTEYNQ